MTFNNTQSFLLNITHLCAAVILSFSLSACSSTNEDVIDIDIEKPSVTRIDLTTGEPITEITPEAEMARRFGSSMQNTMPSADQVDILAMSDRTSVPNVDVYSLEKAGMRASPGAPKAVGVNSTKGPYNVSPSVQVFPLDDAMGDLIGTHLKKNAAQTVETESIDAEKLQITDHLEGRPEPSTILSPPAFKEGQVIRLYFAHDTTDPSAPDMKVIENIAQKVKGDPNFALSIEGHSSSRSSVEDPVMRKIINLKISMDRAFSVARELIAAGVPAKSLYVVGLGESHPSLPMNNMDSESASRRVEIVPIFRQ